MIFSRAIFRQVVNSDQEAENCARLANSLIDSKGIVLYGNYFENGKALNFSNNKSSTDTHTCIAIGMSEMGIFDESDLENIHLNKQEEENLSEILRQRNTMLEREIRELRKGAANGNNSGLGKS